VMTQQGFSRFLFDEVDGQYLLVELAGNSLFGASLREWLDEVPRIAGEEMRRSVQNPQTPDTPVKPEVPEDEIVAEVACSAYALGACLNPQDCTFVAGGFWYEGRCNSQAQVVEVCDANHLYLCTSQAQCEDAMGQGYWYNSTCNNQRGLPDLEVVSFRAYQEVPYENRFRATVVIRNRGEVGSREFQVVIRNMGMEMVSEGFPGLRPGETVSRDLSGWYEVPQLDLLADGAHAIEESDKTNNSMRTDVIPYSTLY